MTHISRLYYFTPKPYKAMVGKLVSNPKDYGSLIKIIRCLGFRVILEWSRTAFKTITDLTNNEKVLDVRIQTVIRPNKFLGN